MAIIMNVVFCCMWEPVQQEREGGQGQLCGFSKGASGVGAGWLCRQVSDHTQQLSM